MKQITQEQEVIVAMEKLGNYATFSKLNQSIDFSNWQTKTPDATIRRIVQTSNQIFRIRRGLWGLTGKKQKILQQLGLNSLDENSTDVEDLKFTHTYYQGLLVEIGKMKGFQTYVPAQDKNKNFLERKLVEITDTVILPEFTYENILKRAKAIDAIWFNERKLPRAFFEVEHSTDIKNALSKFYELQDFRANMVIVADDYRQNQFEEILKQSLWQPIHSFVQFQTYEKVGQQHEQMTKLTQIDNLL